MLIFNTTYHIEEDMQKQFLEFMTDTYIPTAISSGFLHTPCLSRIHSQHKEKGFSYSLQFKVKNSEVLDHWMEEQGENLHQQLQKKFGHKLAGFITLMDEVDLS